MPRVAVVVQVGHGGLQGGLQRVPVVLEEPQNCPPDQSSNKGKGILLWLWDVALFHRQARQAEQDPGQQVHDDLAVDGVVVTEHQPTPNAGCKERMKGDFFPLQSGLQRHQPLVGEHKIGQVPGMSVRSLSNRLQFLS